MKKILVTGANGFLGRALCESLAKQGFDVIAGSRKKLQFTSKQITCVDYGELSANNDYKSLLSGVQVVIHAAARVHKIDDKEVNSYTRYRDINTLATLALAEQAAECGIKRFIFISSVKVNGETTTVDKPFQPVDVFKPSDPYGLSKFEAEQGLLEITKQTEMEAVIIRPPLVYGPGVKANFASMMHWLNQGIPLPLGGINNRRSLVALDNLVSFIIHCIGHPKAANEIFLISDGEDVSTSELLEKAARALGKKARLLPFPVWLIKMLGKLVGKSAQVDRLFGSLWIDSSKARDLLGWRPVITMDAQLKKTAETFLKSETSN